jgi:hypothetical protein
VGPSCCFPGPEQPSPGRQAGFLPIPRLNGKRLLITQATAGQLSIAVPCCCCQPPTGRMGVQATFMERQRGAGLAL